MEGGGRGGGRGGSECVRRCEEGGKARGAGSRTAQKRREFELEPREGKGEEGGGGGARFDTRESRRSERHMC